jgi:hypothetical protein
LSLELQILEGSIFIWHPESRTRYHHSRNHITKNERKANELI